MRRLLVLGAGPAQLGLLEAARARGLFVIAADRDADAPGFRLADRRALVSAEDEPALERLAAAERVDGVVAPGIDWPVAIAARLATRLALPHPLSPQAASLATSKLRQRERFRAAGVPQVDYAVVRSAEEAEEAAARLGYPCVLKAPDRQGQRGLALVADPGSMAAATGEALAASRGGVALVERFVAGREVTVNGFSVAGRFHALTVTDRETAPPPAFGVALAHVSPSTLPSEAVARAADAAERAAAALEIRDGPTYTQVLVREGDACVVELAARLGGGHDAELCEAALGVDLNGLALAAALGDTVDDAALARTRERAACVRFLVPPEGELAAVDGVGEAERVEGVQWVRIYRRPGHRFGPFRRGSDRAGAILAVADTRAEAVVRADRAAGLVRFDVASAAARA